MVFYSSLLCCNILTVCHRERSAYPKRSVGKAISCQTTLISLQKGDLLTTETTEFTEAKTGLFYQKHSIAKTSLQPPNDKISPLCMLCVLHDEFLLWTLNLARSVGFVLSMVVFWNGIKKSPCRGVVLLAEDSTSNLAVNSRPLCRLS